MRLILPKPSLLSRSTSVSSLLLAIGLLTTIIGKSAEAQVLNYNGAVSAPSRNDGPYIIGTLLQVGPTAQTLSALGVQDVNLDGLVSSSQVGIWNATGTTLLGSVTVSNADPLTGDYRYHALSSAVSLSANTQYLLGAQAGTGFETFRDNLSSAAYTASPNFTIIQNRFQTGSALVAPTTDGTGILGRWGAANALVAGSAAPEPGTLALIAGLPLAGLAGLIRRRRK